MYLRISELTAKHVNVYWLSDSDYFKIFEKIINALIDIFENFNRKKNVRQKFKKFKMSSKMLFHAFYINFQRLNILIEYSDSQLMNELKNQLLSRMMKVMIDISSVAVILNDLSKYLIKLNNRQRHFIEVKLFSSKVDALISKTTYVLSDNAYIISIIITSTSTMQINFRMSCKNTSATDWSFYISQSINLSATIICYRCGKTEHYVNKCFKIDKIKNNHVSRIHEIIVNNEILKLKNE